MPITSLTCTSRQAITHKLQLIHDCKLTRIALLLLSAQGLMVVSKRACVASTANKSAIAQKCELLSGDSSRAGWSVAKSSNTILRDTWARSDVALVTTMPSLGERKQEAANTRSPSISTIHTRQLPSAR